MTEDDFDKALATITEALDLWTRTVVSRKPFRMLVAERNRAVATIEKLREFYYEREKF